MRWYIVYTQLVAIYKFIYSVTISYIGGVHVPLGFFHFMDFFFHAGKISRYLVSGAENTYIGFIVHFFLFFILSKWRVHCDVYAVCKLVSRSFRMLLSLFLNC